ncbi:MAG: YkgJ family cysteine cluster protein [Candidatus Hydrogenedentota bacterium]
MTDAWYGNGLRFECQPDCHKCCLREGIVALDPGGSGRASDSEKMAEHLQMPHSEFRRRHVHHDRVNGSYLEDGAPDHSGCPLWRNGCSVYPVRPTQCRTYPFWPELIKSPEKWAEEALFCPGMNKGKLFSFEEIEEISKR